MSINESDLTKGQVRKLNALRKSIGDDLADTAFAKWLKQQTKASKTPKRDVVAAEIAEALKPYQNDKSFNLGRHGYFRGNSTTCAVPLASPFITAAMRWPIASLAARTGSLARCA